MKVCHEARKMENSKHLRSFHNEEKAILDLCSKLGIEIEAVENSHGLTYKFKKKNKVVDIVNIIGVNSFSKKRGRMSVLVYLPKKEKFVLYCKGGNSSMKHVINIGTKDNITYKQLMVNMKINGLKKVVIAQKELSMVDYQNFIRSFRLVSKMTRN